jgi:hypothetical protein
MQPLAPRPALQQRLGPGPRSHALRRNQGCGQGRGQVLRRRPPAAGEGWGPGQRPGRRRRALRRSPGLASVPATAGTAPLAAGSAPMPATGRAGGGGAAAAAARASAAAAGRLPASAETAVPETGVAGQPWGRAGGAAPSGVAVASASGGVGGRPCVAAHWVFSHIVPCRCMPQKPRLRPKRKFFAARRSPKLHVARRGMA